MSYFTVRCIVCSTPYLRPSFKDPGCPRCPRPPVRVEEGQLPLLGTTRGKENELQARAEAAVLDLGFVERQLLSAVRMMMAARGAAPERRRDYQVAVAAELRAGIEACADVPWQNLKGVARAAQHILGEWEGMNTKDFATWERGRSLADVLRGLVLVTRAHAGTPLGDVWGES